MNADLLRERVYGLAARFSWLGMTPDIAAMTVAELEAALRLLVRLYEASGGQR